MGSGAALNQKSDRTWELKLLIAGFLILAFSGGLRLWQSLLHWQLIGDLNARPGALYMAAYGACMLLAGLVGALALSLRPTWAGLAAKCAAGIAAGWYWLDRLAFTRSVSARTNLVFAIAFSLLCLAAVWGILALPRQRRYLAKQDKEKQT